MLVNYGTLTGSALTWVHSMPSLLLIAAVAGPLWRGGSLPVSPP